MAKKNYVEPVDYFPKEILKEFGLGEYNKEAKADMKKRPNLPDEIAKRKKKAK